VENNLNKFLPVKNPTFCAEESGSNRLTRPPQPSSTGSTWWCCTRTRPSSSHPTPSRCPAG